MKIFVIHYPPLVDRKRELLKQLETFNLEAEWVEHWNKGDPFVSHVKEKTRARISLAHLSAFVKRLWVYQKMIDEDIQEAIIFEDDVVIHPEIKNFSTGPKHLDYLRLGIGIAETHQEGIERSATRLHRVANPGGGEAVWVTQKFARNFLNNLNFDMTHDIVEFAALGMVVYGVPICHQTSLLDPDTSSCEASENTGKWWVAYSDSYEYLPKWSFSELLSDFN